MAIASLTVVSLGALPPGLYEEINALKRNFHLHGLALILLFGIQSTIGVLGFDSESWEKKPQTQTFVLQYQSLTICFDIDHADSAIASLSIVSLGCPALGSYE